MYSRIRGELTDTENLIVRGGTWTSEYIESESGQENPARTYGSGKYKEEHEKCIGH